MNDYSKHMTRDQIIEKLSENKRDELEGAIEGQVEDYEADLDSLTDQKLSKEYEEVFGHPVQIVAQETGSE
jgi:hypothetical protein